MEHFIFASFIDIEERFENLRTNFKQKTNFDLHLYFMVIRSSKGLGYDYNSEKIAKKHYLKNKSKAATIEVTFFYEPDSPYFYYRIGDNVPNKIQLISCDAKALNGALISNEDLNWIKASMDKQMPVNKSYVRALDASNDLYAAIKYVVDNLPASLKGNKENNTEAKEKPDKPYNDFTANFVKFEKTTNATFPTKIIKLPKNEKDAFSQTVITEADKNLKTLADADRKTYIYHVFNFHEVWNEGKDSGIEYKYTDARSKLDASITSSNVLMVQKIWTQEKETDKEFTTKYDERLYLMPGLDAACKKAIEDEIKVQNSSNSGKQFGIKYDDALKKRAEILKSKLEKCAKTKVPQEIILYVKRVKNNSERTIGKFSFNYGD
jgi:ribosome-associated translation inhibitor RaiA